MHTERHIITKTIVVILMAISVAAGTGGKTNHGSRPYIGVKIDPNPLPRLLAKHLKLEDGRGLLVVNVQANSPADEGGIEKDDIIVRFQNKDVNNYEQFVNDIRQAGAGEKVTLEVIRSGKNIKIDLVTAEAAKITQAKPKWKYPFSAKKPLENIRPGRIFRKGPDDQKWQQMPFGPFGEIPWMHDYTKPFSRYYYNKDDGNGQKHEITVDGDPDNPDSRITVKIRNEKLQSTIGEIDEMPEEFRNAALDAIQNARSSIMKIDLYDDWPGEIDQQIQQQMERLSERMRQMEQWQQEMLEQFGITAPEKEIPLIENDPIEEPAN